MTLSHDLYLGWSCMCSNLLGHVPAMNDIEPGMVTHVVADEDPPLVLPDGDTVRRISMQYTYEDYKYEIRS